MLNITVHNYLNGKLPKMKRNSQVPKNQQHATEISLINYHQTFSQVIKDKLQYSTCRTCQHDATQISRCYWL